MRDENGKNLAVTCILAGSAASPVCHFMTKLTFIATQGIRLTVNGATAGIHCFDFGEFRA